MSQALLGVSQALLDVLQPMSGYVTNLARCVATHSGYVASLAGCVVSLGELEALLQRLLLCLPPS